MDRLAPHPKVLMLVDALSALDLKLQNVIVSP